MPKFRLIGLCTQCGTVREDDVATAVVGTENGPCTECFGFGEVRILARPKGLFRKIWTNLEGNQVA